jgi:hypothetical protein
MRKKINIWHVCFFCDVASWVIFILRGTGIGVVSVDEAAKVVVAIVGGKPFGVG